MKKTLIACAAAVLAAASFAERVPLWPEGAIPFFQDRQIAAMTDESCAPGFDPATRRMPYIDWCEAPDPSVKKDVCMILISGGGYYNCCDTGLVSNICARLTAEGIQCVNFVYRTPRPEGLPIYASAWADAQRAVRLVRKQAARRGFDPEKIGTASMSAGSHLGLLLATSSQTPAYEKVDEDDKIPCHINWAIVNAPAYATTDGEAGTPSIFQGYNSDVRLSSVFKFDWKTCPMSLHHGGLDVFSPNASTLVYRQLRRMRIPAEVHLYPDKPHGAYGLERGVEFMRQMGFIGKLAPEENIDERFPSDSDRAEYIREDIWPEGKTPCFQDHMNTPYIEWHFPKVKKTDYGHEEAIAVYGHDPRMYETTVKEFLKDERNEAQVRFAIRHLWDRIEGR